MTFKVQHPPAYWYFEWYKEAELFYTTVVWYFQCFVGLMGIFHCYSARKTVNRKFFNFLWNLMFYAKCRLIKVSKSCRSWYSLWLWSYEDIGYVTYVQEHAKPAVLDLFMLDKHELLFLFLLFFCLLQLEEAWCWRSKSIQSCIPINKIHFCPKILDRHKALLLISTLWSMFKRLALPWI